MDRCVRERKSWSWSEIKRQKKKERVFPVERQKKEASFFLSKSLKIIVFMSFCICQFIVYWAAVEESSSVIMSQKDEPSRILKYLYLGGKAHAKDRNLLRKLNITHVVNCSPSRRLSLTVDTHATTPFILYVALHLLFSCWIVLAAYIVCVCVCSVDKNFGIPNYFSKDGITYLRVPIFE
jgi:hypothetical protein